MSSTWQILYVRVIETKCQDVESLMRSLIDPVPVRHSKGHEVAINLTECIVSNFGRAKLNLSIKIY